MSAVRSPRSAELQIGRSRLGWAMAVGMTCLLAASMVFLRHLPPREGNTLEPASAPAELALNLNVNLPSVAQVDQWTKTLDAPLEQETKLVLRDAAVAINSLARGFLPEDLLTSPTELAQP